MMIGIGVVLIDNINIILNLNFYIDNFVGGNNYNIEMDGMIVILIIKVLVVFNQLNMIKIGIVDVGDVVYDLNFLIFGNSIIIILIVNDDLIIIGQGNSGVFDFLVNDMLFGVSFMIIYING